MSAISNEKIYKIIEKIGLIDPSVLDTALKTSEEEDKDFITLLIQQDLILLI